MGLRSKLRGRLKRMLGKSPEPPRAVPVMPKLEPSEDSTYGDEAVAEELANIECEAQELRERLECGEHIVIVDVRTHGEVAGGVLPGALHIPMSELQARWEELQDANEIVCYCAIGARSYSAAQFLRSKGCINATSLDGGVSGWAEVGGEFVALA